MENRGITFGYGFLSQESSFDVQFSLIEFDGSHSYFRALKYEWEPSNSINENCTSKEDSWDKKPYPKVIPLFSILTCAL